MRAAIYRQFGGPISIDVVADPAPSAHGVVVEVRASGVCRSDLRGWMGRDPDIVLPHVPGHELAGVVVAVGAEVATASLGDRVTVPFCGGCGTCPTCRTGNNQICDRATQPGFTGWGSFAEFVAIEQADENLIHLPETIGDTAAALLGCRFITAHRAVVDRAAVRPGEWLAVHGCGGVGLSAVMIATAVGARVIAIDVDGHALDRATALGAEITIDASSIDDIPSAVRSATEGGAHASIDALGAPVTVANSLLGLRKLGRHVQAGLFHDDTPPVPMNAVIGRELQILGTHGMAAHKVPELLEMVAAGSIDPELLVERTIGLDDVEATLVSMRDDIPTGITVVTAFS